MPKGNPPPFGPKSGCRSRPAESMLRIQAALWAFTGNREMSVFHTLLAGNIGQFGAPGTVVPPPPRPAACAGGMAARPLPVPATGAWASLAARTAPGEAPEPCRRPVTVPVPAGGPAAVPQAARNASAATVVRIVTGVVRSGLPTGLILPRQAQPGAASAWIPRPGAGHRRPARGRLAEPGACRLPAVKVGGQLRKPRDGGVGHRGLVRRHRAVADEHRPHADALGPVYVVEGPVADEHAGGRIVL